MSTYDNLEDRLNSEEQLIPASVPELEPGSEEIAITKIVHDQLKDQNCLLPGERESVAYRLAEIMVSAKNLYVEVLPRLVNCDKNKPLSQDEDTEDEHEHNEHSCDCVNDCDEDEDEDRRPAIEDTPIFNELAGARMAFIHLRDLIADFDDAFMVAMASQREADGNKDKLEEADFEYEE